MATQQSTPYIAISKRAIATSGNMSPLETSHREQAGHNTAQGMTISAYCSKLTQNWALDSSPKVSHWQRDAIQGFRDLVH